jgi:hypothetical protein
MSSSITRFLPGLAGRVDPGAPDLKDVRSSPIRDRYVCSWCELHGSQLILVPTPQSRGQARHIRYPGDATIVGRVTAVTMRIAEARESSTKGPSLT